MECKEVYEFDDFVFDMNGYKLFRNGHPVSLQQRTGELLGLLIENAHLGSISKETILDRLYGKSGPGTDYALYFQVHQLRKALADDARNPKYIRFAKKRGIQFIGKVRARKENGGDGDRAIVAAPTDNLIDETVASSHVEREHKQWVWKMIVPLSILLVILIIPAFILKRNPALSGRKIIPRIDSITALSATVAGRQIYVQLKGEGFDPRTVRVLVTGAGCSDTDPCHVPNEPLHWYGSITDLQIERVPLTLAPGDFQIFVQNGPDGEASNAVPLTIKVE